MAQYKISQSPGTKKPKIKSFWIPQAQEKTLNKKVVITSVSVASVALIVGAVAATIHFRDKPIYLHGAPPPIGKSVKEGPKSSNNVYTVSAVTFKAVTSAINTKNASLLGSYYASQVHIIITGSLVNETVNANNAGSIVTNGLSGFQAPWNFHVPANELAGWQSGPYGQFFDGIDVVGISGDGEVVSIGFNTSGQVDTVFIAPADTLDPPSGSSGSSGPSQTETSPSQQITSENSTD
jgi:hypothetical protein